ncbi:MAG: 50S ribosomal protein L30 [Clostridiales Family XIII bacterium]|jgi:large subunit ribosomal protein L30|nr:50S ribosomal protein L30 [Clostridiales Family XIII bacterium]
MAKIKVTLTKSPIGAIPAHRKIVRALGLTKMNKTVELEDCPAARGAVNKVRHLVTVAEDK